MIARLKGAINGGYEALARRLPPRARVRLIYLKCHKHWPDLRRPSRFSELCQVMKFSSDHLARFVDKAAVKDFVADAVRHEYLIPTLFAGNELPPIEQRNWPLPFIIKTTHTSGGNIFVREKPDWPSIERDLAGWLSVDYSKVSNEQFYSAVPPRVLVEPLIGDNLNDYKIFTFGGKPTAIQVDTDRQNGHKRAFFDTGWNRLDMRCKYPLEQREVERPKNLDKMLEIASTLGRNFPFVRVDLYEVDGRVFFGELTFCPEAGQARFEPAEIETDWGKLWLDALDAPLGSRDERLTSQLPAAA